MGNRVHKSIGYAVRNFKHPDDWEEITYRAGTTGLGEFAIWSTTRIAEVASLAKVPVEQAQVTISLMTIEDNNSGSSLGSYVIEDFECGIEGVLQLVPPGMHNFKRYDDLIDWVEASDACLGSGSGPIDYARDLKIGLYPFTFGTIPSTVVSLAMWLGIPEVIPNLKETLYVYWG